MDSPDINYPTPPSYGESLEEALKAQTDLLRGTGEFEGTGGLQALVEQYEAPLRKSTAQIDTDVLRQTLLGGDTPAQETEVTYDDQGRIVLGFEEGPQYQVRQKIVGRPYIQEEGDFSDTFRDLSDYSHDQHTKDNPDAKYRFPKNAAVQIELLDPDGNVVAYSEEKLPTFELNAKDQDNFWEYANKGARSQMLSGDNPFIDFSEQYTKATEELRANIPDSVPENVVNTITTNIENRGQLGRERALDQISVPTGEEGRTIYARNALGEIIQEPTKAGTTETRVLPAERTEDGMIDLLGDRRQAIDPATGLPTGRQAGFDEQGNFLGLSALAEDIQRGNLSRQREADLADVERLSGRFQDVMADYRPGTTEALAGAREVLEAQRQRLVGQPASDQVDKSPLAVLNQGFRDIEEDYQSTLDQYGQQAADALRADAMNRLETQAATAGLTMDQVQAGPQAQPAQLTGFQDPTFTAETQLTGDAGLLGVLQSATQADVDAGRATRVGETIQVDPLRARLIQDARSALGEGLTEREERQIAEAARARATMMGRTFDQSEAIAEAQARVAEDNQRRMQNRAFASQILGQEAGLQSGDLGRGMQQELRQVGADMDAERLRQAQTSGFIDASTRLAGLEASTTMDPFAALLNRAGGGSLGQAGQVFGQAGYGLSSGPQFLNPESGLGFISQMAANEASMYGAQQAADASRGAGLLGGLGALGGGLFQGAGAAQGFGNLFCWVAREVYGPFNPQWLQFREWMLSESPNWFYNMYAKYGERFANWISDKPRIKAIIRKWMDSKIGDK